MLKFIMDFLRGFIHPPHSPPPPAKPKTPVKPGPLQVPPVVPVQVPAAPPATKAGKTAAWLTIAVVIVAGFEGLYTHPYRDVVGVLTVCYGETAADQVDLQRTYTPQECKDLLARDLPKYDAEVRRCIHVAMSPNTEAAVVSLAYNVGAAAVCRGSVAHLLNAGDHDAACHAFRAYDRAGGRVIQGLVNRRIAEEKLCLKA